MQKRLILPFLPTDFRTSERMTRKILFPLTILVMILFAYPSLGQVINASLTSPGNAGMLAEGCPGPFELVIRTEPGLTDTVFISVSTSGVAMVGVDYDLEAVFPLMILPGDPGVEIPITVTDDGNTEGIESLHFLIAYMMDGQTGQITLETSITDEYQVEIQSAEDTIIWCSNVPYVLLANADAEIHWEPSQFFDDAQGTAATVRPEQSGWVYAVVGDETCSARDSVYFDLAIVEILLEDTVNICKGEDGVVLFAQFGGLATDFVWTPADTTLSDPNSLNPVANPTITTTYTIQSDIGICTAVDRVVVRVDSLPQDLHIDIAPLKPYYCAGEIVALFSPTYDSLSFPDITFDWDPDDGTFLSADTLLNAALELRDTTLYIRANINNACISYDSILINVVPPGVPISVSDTTLCPGEMFTVSILSDQVTDPEWNPTDGLSCSTCLSPKVTVIGALGTTMTYEFSGKILECPVGASLSVHVPDFHPINIEGETVACEGDQIQLNITNPENLSGFNWSVTSGDASLSCNNCIDPLVTINGSNTVTLMVTGNPDTSSICAAQGIINIVNGGQTDLGDTTITVCMGESVTLDLGLDVTGTQWNVTSGDIILSCTDCDNPEATVISAGSLSFTGETTIGNFCTATGTVMLEIGETVQLPGIDFNVCGSGDTVTIWTGEKEVFDIEWTIQTGDGSISCTECDFPLFTYFNQHTTLGFSGQTSLSGFCRATGTVTIRKLTEEFSEIMVTDPPMGDIPQGLMVTTALIGNFLAGTPMWTVNGGSIPGNESSIVFSADEESNVVIVKFINVNGCEQSDTLIVNTVPPSYMIPNAFTPADSDKNNRFRVLITGDIAVEEFSVFNRWGQLVYKSEGNDEMGWDGNFKGQPAASDTYVYLAKLRYPNGRQEIAKGDVILLR